MTIRDRVEWRGSGWIPAHLVPHSERRVLVAQDDGYIEMAYWNGSDFEWDHIEKPVPRVRYWCDLPNMPTEDGK